MTKENYKPPFGVDTYVVAICFAMAPIQGGLDLGIGVSLNKYISFAAMISVIMVGLLSRQYCIDSKVTNQLLPFAFICVISIIWASDKPLAFTALISYISYFLFFIIICSRYWNIREKLLFRRVIILSDSIYAFLLVREMLAGSLRSSVSFTSTGTFADQNVISVNIVLGFILSLDFFSNSHKGLTRLIWLLLCSLMLSGIISTGSRGAFIALIISTVFYLVKSKDLSKTAVRNVIIAGIVLALVYLILMNTENSFLNQFIISRYTDFSTFQGGSGRFEIWQRYLTGLFRNPLYLLVGTGAGCTSDVVRSYLGNIYINATHNDLLYTICTFGVVGVTFFIKFLRFIWKKAKDAGDVLSLTCMLGLLIGCMDVNLIQSNGFWIGLIMAYICIGVNNE